MNVKLISYTVPADPEIASNMMELTAYIARVSNPSNQQNKETSERLINYCINHKHWSVFEHTFATLEITTTRDIARQILRHRGAYFQEWSQRYSDPTSDLGFVTREARLQDLNNRQNSIETNDESLQEKWKHFQEDMIIFAKESYSWAIENGVAKEQARAILPEGLTVSRMYMTNNIRNWIHYIQLRSGVETQKEHREVAIACADSLEPIFPMIKQFVSGV
nr:MAG: thymidylate synthase (FAD) [Caudoviricetes sp.]